MKRTVLHLFHLFCAVTMVAVAVAQGGDGAIDLEVPSEYRIAGVTVLGAEYTDVQAVKLFSGLQVGDEIAIPGDRLSDAVRNLWDQRLFSDVSIELAERRDRDVYLVIRVQEMPRLTRYGFTGIKRGEQETLRGKLDLVRGQIVNENLKVTTKRILQNHYLEKGYFDAAITVTSSPDSVLENAAGVNIDVDKGEKIKVGVIRVDGADALGEKAVKRRMKNVKERAWWRIFKPSKYLEQEFNADLESIVAFYREKGYRNARIAGDSLFRTPEGELGIALEVD